DLPETRQGRRQEQQNSARERIGINEGPENAVAEDFSPELRSVESGAILGRQIFESESGSFQPAEVLVECRAEDDHQAQGQANPDRSQVSQFAQPEDARVEANDTAGELQEGQLG